MRDYLSCASRKVVLLVLYLLLSGCATTGSGDPRDPFEGFNRGVYSFNQAMDTAVFDPLGKIYQAITPDIVDKGVTNFFSNLNDIAVVVNDVLQFKINQALSDTTRFIFNSTIGLLGFFDVSSHIDLPKHDEDFGQTLANWGIGSGPYLVIPFFGPATIRDATGYVVDTGILNPVFYIDDDALRASLLSLNYIDFKADLLSAYFEKRDNQINDRDTAEFPEEE